MPEKENITKEKKLLQPKVDVVFQSLFNKDNEEITKSFVESLLERKVSSIVINDTKELARENPNDKLGILDLELDVDDREKVDVEIQLIKNPYFANRLLYYGSRLYSKQIKRGSLYRKAKRVVVIAIVDFEMEITKGLDRMETIWNFREAKNPERVLTDLMEIRIINLKRVMEEYQKDKSNEKNQWMMFLANPNSREVEEIMEKNEDVKKAVVTMRKMSEDEKMEKLAELREDAIMLEKDFFEGGREEGLIEGEKRGRASGLAEGRASGLKEGRATGLKEGRASGLEEGRKETTKEIVKNMLNNNIEIEIIEKATGLTKIEIEKIGKEK